MLRLDARSLVVLVGASAAGKSTWAGRWFRSEQIVSSDALRAVVGETARDQRASDDAFDLLHRIVERRVGRRLLTVVDTTGTDATARARWRAWAHEAGVPAVAVVLAPTTTELRRRNRARPRPVPDRVVSSQARIVRDLDPVLVAEGWQVVAGAAEPVVVVPPVLVHAPEARHRQQEDPVPLAFSLSVPAFDFGDLGVRDGLAGVARAAEEVGFHALYVMDHVVQVTRFGPVWAPMLESTTTLGWLAGVTDQIRLGALVNGITHRNLVWLGHQVAALDVLSGGRAICGLGAAWSDREHALLGEDLPSLDERYARLEDALELLPLLWGPGSPSYAGRTIDVAEAICYPRPVQEPHPPLLVGGGGERRTLRLAAAHADAINVIGDAELVTRKRAVLAAHCAELDRDPAEVRVTQLEEVVVGRDAEEVARLVDAQRPADRAIETWATQVNAGTVQDQVGRYRVLAEAGVDEAVVTLAPQVDVAAIERFAPVIQAFT